MRKLTKGTNMDMTYDEYLAFYRHFFVVNEKKYYF